MKTEKPDYGDFSDQELAEELTDLDEDIAYWQKMIANNKKMINSAMEAKEDILDIVKQRSQQRGWPKKG